MAKSKNMLDFVPKRSKKINWQIRETGLVRICVKHRGFYSKLAQMLVKAPPISNIDMDQFGSFIWNAIDGRRTVAEIAEMVKQRFGKDAEPLYQRLTAFFRILYANRLISFEIPKTGNPAKALPADIMKKGA